MRVGRPKGKRMTIELARLVAGGVLIPTLLWFMHRLGLIRRQLIEIQGEVDALRDSLSRVFLAQLNRKEVDQSQVRTINGSGRSRIKQSDPPGEPSDPTPPPPSDPTAKNDRRENEVLKQGELEFEVVEINGLCAKLITLVPPEEAAPLLLPERAPPRARERRLSPRHQTSKVGRSFCIAEALATVARLATCRRPARYFWSPTLMVLRSNSICRWMAIFGVASRDGAGLTASVCNSRADNG
jgi:hypothetical protein